MFCDQVMTGSLAMTMGMELGLSFASERMGKSRYVI